MLFPAVVQAQILNGCLRLPILQELRWGMSRAEVIAICAAHNISVQGVDSIATLDAVLFAVPTKVSMLLKGKTKRLGQVDVKFTDHNQALADTLVRQLTALIGDSPVKVEKEKNVLLFTLRMEIAMWQTKTERLALVVGKKGSSIFEIKLIIMPTET